MLKLVISIVASFLACVVAEVCTARLALLLGKKYRRCATRQWCEWAAATMSCLYGGVLVSTFAIVFASGMGATGLRWLIALAGGSFVLIAITSFRSSTRRRDGAELHERIEEFAKTGSTVNTDCKKKLKRAIKLSAERVGRQIYANEMHGLLRVMHESVL
jgi:hypothetical protein